MQPLTVQIEGMTCGHCVEEVTATLRALSSVHVHSVQVGSATITFYPQKISLEGIGKAFR
jgi:copper chaperone